MRGALKTQKVMTLKEAIEKYIMPGKTVFLAGMQHGEPSAAIHEIVRQRIGHLTIIPVLTQTIGLLLGEGLVKNLITAYVGDLYERMSCISKRMTRMGTYPALEELSHHGLAVALQAGSAGIPFMITRSQLGSDLVKHNPNLKEISCPFSGQKLLAVKAINPDVGIVHVQRCDSYGNAHKWGSLGLDSMGINACKEIIITTEEIVDPKVIRLDPNRTMVPGFRVSAVVEAKWGAYPMHLSGYYNSDLSSFSKIVSDEKTYEKYVAEYIYAVKNHEEMMKKIITQEGIEHLDKLRLKHCQQSIPITTGF